MKFEKTDIVAVNDSKEGWARAFKDLIHILVEYLR